MKNKTWFMTLIMFYIMSSNLLAQTDEPTAFQTVRAMKLLCGIIIFIICFLRRKKAVGGWLLLYFISLFFGIFVWGILFFSLCQI